MCLVLKRWKGISARTENVSESHNYKCCSLDFVKVLPLRRTLCNNACVNLFVLLKHSSKLRALKLLNDYCGTLKPLLRDTHLILVSQYWVAILWKLYTKQYERSVILRKYLRMLWLNLLSVLHY